MIANKRFIIKGINDDQNTCDLCGKQRLKKVIWLEDTEENKIIAVGTTCAAKLQKISIKQQKINETAWEKQRANEIENGLKKLRHAALMVNCPIKFGEGNYIKRRLEWFKNNPETVAYEQKRKELAKKYSLPLDQIR